MLDYSDPTRAVNYRDVGLFLNLIAAKQVLPERRLLRGGTLQHIHDLSVVGSPATIVCLKNGPGRHTEGATLLHYPRPNTIECYETAKPESRVWLRKIIAGLADSATKLPIYVHCHSGRDRTGVVVAALLTIIGLSHDLITEEYMLSEDAASHKIAECLAGLANDRYFPERHARAIRALLLN